MNDEDRLEQHLDLCRKVALRLIQDGQWPWADSPNSEDMVESEDNPNPS